MANGKGITSISIDVKVKGKAQEILKKKGYSLSFYVEQILRKLIQENQKEVQNGVIRR